MEVYQSSKTAEEMEYALGAVPSIGENGNWFIGDEDTGKPSQGEPGRDGIATDEQVQTSVNTWLNENGAGGGWKKVAEHVWDGNKEFQPLTLDYATGEMTFSETVPTNRSVWPTPNLGAAQNGTLVNLYAKIPNEFMNAHMTSVFSLGENGYKFGNVSAVAEGGANANVDVSAFHFEHYGTVPSFTGLNAKRVKIRMTACGGNIWQSNGDFSFYVTLSNGQNIYCSVGNGTGGRIMDEIIEQDISVHGRVISADFITKKMLYRSRTSGSQGYSNDSFVGVSPFTITDDGVTITGVSYNAGNGNYMPSNGTLVEVFEHVD